MAFVSKIWRMAAPEFRRARVADSRPATSLAALATELVLNRWGWCTVDGHAEYVGKGPLCGPFLTSQPLFSPTSSVVISWERRRD